MGIFDPLEPLRLKPFELRLLARREPPRQSVIDLSSDDAVLRSPRKYFTIPRAEDRLFIREEYVPLFVEKGWKRGV